MLFELNLETRIRCENYCQQNGLIDNENIRINRSYYDTFDWSLWMADRLLCLEESGQTSLVRLANRKTGHTMCIASLSNLPDWVSLLPASPLREKLSPIVNIRKLLNHVELVGTGCSLLWHDQHQKTRLRGFLVEAHLHHVGTQERSSLKHLLILNPLRGYPKALTNARHGLSEILAESSHCTTPLHLALDNFHLSPESYRSKISVVLNSESTAHCETRRLLSHLLDTLELNDAGTRERIDTEFLHQFRVSGRRIRSALSQLRTVFPKQDIAHFQKEFKWLGEVTGAPRDLDVHLLAFESLKQLLPEAQRENLEPLRDHMETVCSQSYRSLTTHLNSPRYELLLKDFRNFVQAPSSPENIPKEGEKPVREIANKNTLRTFRKLLQEGRDISKSSPDEAFHDLRKTCKKFRYMMEFFVSLHPKGALTPLIKTLKKLQGILGEFQDLEVQQHTLEVFKEQMLQTGLAPTQTILAINALVGILRKRQGSCREQFFAAFAAFDTSTTRRQARILFLEERASP